MSDFTSPLAGIPVVVNDLLPKDAIRLIGKNTSRVRVEVGSMQALRDAIDDDFLRQCGIIRGLACPIL